MKKLIIGGLFGLMVGGIIFFLFSEAFFILSDLSIFRDFEWTSLDFRFTATKVERKSVIEDVVVIDIDNDSLRHLGRWQNWPRKYYAEVIDYATKDGAKAIGFDIFFPEYSNPKDDNALIETTKKSGNVIHSFFFPETSETKQIYNLEPMKKFSLSLPSKGFFQKNSAITPSIIEIQEVAKGIGYDNKYPDKDGKTRLISLVAKYQDRLYLSLSLATVCSVLNVKPDQIKFKDNYLLLSNKKKIPVEEGAKMWIKYLGPSRTFRFVSFYNVLKKRLGKGQFKDKIAIIGGSAEGLFDIMSNPFSSVYPGVETHATIIYNILNNNFLKRIHSLFSFAIVLFLGIMVGISSSFLSLKKGILVTNGLLFGYLTTSIILFKNGLIIPMVSPSFSMGLSFLSVWLWRFQTEEREKKKVRGMFSRYVSKDVVEVLVSNPDAFSIGGKRLELSVLFSDICGFTTLSEKLQAEEIVSLLNEYFTAMNQIIFKHKGTLDKYIGDAIMVFYGAPLYPEDHAKRAVLTALEMIRELNRLKKEWKARGKEELDIGIGINTGEMVVGNIGSDIQTNYTVIGDEVNLASRLEGMTRRYDAQIIISKATHEKIKDEILSREVDLIVVKGKTRPVMIYEPIGLINEVGEEKKKQLEVFQNGLLLYKEKKWKEAASVFFTIMEDGVSRMYFMRCQDYIASPPPADWDGVYVYKTK
ncbi:MAG: adenylate/guanylate cyclase domain-containing protein [bacterium]